MKHALMLIGALAVMTLASQNAEAARCRGCAKLKAVTAKFKGADSKDSKQMAALVKQASDALSELPRDAEGHLAPNQVEAVVELLRVSHAHDPAMKIIDDSKALFDQCAPEIIEGLKKIPVAEAKAIAQEVELVLAESENGNDPGFQKPVKPAPAKKNNQ